MISLMLSFVKLIIVFVSCSIFTKLFPPLAWGTFACGWSSFEVSFGEDEQWWIVWNTCLGSDTIGNLWEFLFGLTLWKWCFWHCLWFFGIFWNFLLTSLWFFLQVPLHILSLFKPLFLDCWLLDHFFRSQTIFSSSFLGLIALRNPLHLSYTLG